MARQKKDGAYANFYLDKGINAMLDEYCELTDRTKTAIVERALRDYFNSHPLQEKKKDKKDS